MTEQVGVNYRALANLAARLEHLGYTGDALAEAEAIAVSLIADGYRKLEPPPPLTGPHSTDAKRTALVEATRRDLAERKRNRLAAGHPTSTHDSTHQPAQRRAK